MSYKTLILTLFSLLAFQYSTPIIASNGEKSLVVDVVDNARPCIIHVMQNKETLYSLTRRYDVSLESIYQYNPQLTSTIVKVDDRVLIPFSKKIVTYPSANPSDRVKVYYKVKPKETLFRVARIYFSTTIEHLRELNHLEGNNLNVGQKLLIGYLGEETDISTSSLEDDDLSGYTLDGATWIESKNLAFWYKDAPTVEGLFVMHRDAPINSFIEIYNPMYDRTVQAKVIGRLPRKAYTDDIDMIISQGLAKELGAFDSRFYVKVKYRDYR